MTENNDAMVIAEKIMLDEIEQIFDKLATTLNLELRMYEQRQRGLLTEAKAKVLREIQGFFASRETLEEFGEILLEYTKDDDEEQYRRRVETLCAGWSGPVERYLQESRDGGGTFLSEMRARVHTAVDRQVRQVRQILHFPALPEHKRVA